MARVIVARNGGILFLQQLALMGSVYGFVDVLVKLEACAGEVGKEMAAAGILEGNGCGLQELGEKPAGGDVSASAEHGGDGRGTKSADRVPASQAEGGSVGGEGEEATAAGSALVAGETPPAASVDGEDSPAADGQAEKGGEHELA